MTEYFWLSWSFGTAGFVLSVSGATMAILHVRRDLAQHDEERRDEEREAFLEKLKRDKLQRDKEKRAGKNKNNDEDDDDNNNYDYDGREGPFCRCTLGNNNNDGRYTRASERGTWRIDI